MQSIPSYLLIPMVMLIVHNVRITCNLFSENEDDTNYKSGSLSSPSAGDSQKLIEENDNWRDLYKLIDDKFSAFSQRSPAPNTVTYDMHNNYNNQDEDTVRQLLHQYVELIRNSATTTKRNERNFDNQRVQNKRGLTMLSRWKPFRIPVSPSGNGRHVIRSPIMSGTDASTFTGKLQFMGRPFRWG